MHAVRRMAFLGFAVFLMVTGTNVLAQAKAHDPNTTVFSDALWFRVHAADCPELILKDMKKTMTLEQADKAGARIGEAGQSGRTNCCLQGYKRKHPKKKLNDQTLLAGDNEPGRYKHIPGCHRYFPDRTHVRRTRGEWVAGGFKVCPHCIERGPSVAAVSDEAWNQLPSPESFVAPEGYTPKPFPTDALPPQKEVDLLIQEALAKSNGILELQFTDPVASMENFVTMRFFFPVGNWLEFYKAYRATGDKRLLDKMRESARHYNKLSRAYPTVAQAKASDPEGMPYLYTMAVTARITLQLAKKHPDQVSVKEIYEAQVFLQTAVAVLKPTCEGSDGLDPDMGIPQPLADDFRFRAYNRSMNGIGTLATIAAALEDLQAIKQTQHYQPVIDRYRKVVQAYIQYWHSRSHFCTKVKGETRFYYSYAPREGEPKIVDGCVIFKRPEDAGHYSHSLQGAMLIYEATPELGIDDAFMTAVANAIHHNATTLITRRNKQVRSGHLECSVASKERPYGKNKGGHQYSPARERFYLLQAFRNDMIDGLGTPLNEQQKTQANSEYDKRLATLHAQYLKALRKDTSLIHLGEK